METQNLQAIAIIPARYGSTRLKGKPLVDICGKPLIQRVWEAASKSRILKRIVIATDDTRIADECFNFGAEYILTTSNLPSGTDRILSAYIELKEDAEFIVNIQGDEPLLTSQIIDDLIIKFIPSKADVGTLVRKIETFEELSNSSNVKVVLKKGNLALSFSRNIIPYLRDVETNDWLFRWKYLKHIGIYIYRRNSLFRFAAMPPSELENAEKLEQLRLLSDGAEYFCMETDANLIGVDTPEDLEQIRMIFDKSKK